MAKREDDWHTFQSKSFTFRNQLLNRVSGNALRSGGCSK
jgi:hypothetical protein